MQPSNDVILPPATIGIIGGGQLGQMMALVAKSMGYKVGVLDPTPEAPAAQVADFQIIADYTDVKSLTQLAHASAVLTYEFENVDQQALQQVTAIAAVPQGIDLLTVTGNRLNEKRFCVAHGLPVTPFSEIHTIGDLERARQEIGCPGILKTVTGGYDGHGQVDINETTDLETIAPQLSQTTWIYERRQTFDRELSIMVTQDGRGQTVTFPVSENQHRHHILKTSIVADQLSQPVVDQAQKIAGEVAQALALRGVLGIEFFERPDGQLMINELAPRPHNSGHYSIEACNVSQFEAHIRSICGLPIPPIQQTQKAVMVNLLGDDLVIARQKLVQHPEWHFHDYGKQTIRTGRKMGHITVTGSDLDPLLVSTQDFR
ncbi:5-(carboxyamino)imidazole ribonucleotide synthase [uncultured Secundilactobacillus sp.]|uniref:5-(carboxyamino)imidazole ribonucleotide synthase n=1 Tax=uncultured Secundilactobacillus sp. TaxID=2813935 RepID=UPI002583D866|nr:5-(carboxyamino)imidazole ribonucleotide synthase [uncultured Secundilactobacillus sp.]